MLHKFSTYLMYVLHYSYIYIYFFFYNTSGSIYIQLCTILVSEKNVNLGEKFKVDQFNIICNYELFLYVIIFQKQIRKNAVLCTVSVFYGISEK